MATASSNSQKKQYPSLPPKRGRIKAQIFESFGEAVSSVTSKAGEVLKKFKGVGAGGGSSGSGFTTPRPSQCTSDDYSDHA